MSLQNEKEVGLLLRTLESEWFYIENLDKAHNFKTSSFSQWQFNSRKYFYHSYLWGWSLLCWNRRFSVLTGCITCPLLTYVSCVVKILWNNWKCIRKKKQHFTTLFIMNFRFWAKHILRLTVSLKNSIQVSRE